MRWRYALIVIVGLATGVTWGVASWYLEDGPLGLLPFTAPGAIVALAVGWLSRAFSRRPFTWRTGLWCTVAGAVMLPPWIGAAFAAIGLTTAGALVLVVVGAWAALALGGLLALATLLGERLQRRRAP